MPLSVFAMIDSVTSRPHTVRGGKWRPGVDRIRPLRTETPMICEASAIPSWGYFRVCSRSALLPVTRVLERPSHAMVE
jgi:hypothetical protein